jgi:hypothetical protein
LYIRHGRCGVVFDANRRETKVEAREKALCSGGREEVVGAQEEEELWLLLPVSDVLAVAAPEGPVVRLGGYTAPFHLNQQIANETFRVADPHKTDL